MGTHLRVLIESYLIDNEYQHDIFVLLTKVALEGLIYHYIP